jgi:hypothetical protein
MIEVIDTGCLTEPKNSRIVLIKEWQLDLCEGNHCAAAILNFLIYWHGVKIKQSKKAKEANDISEMHGGKRDQDESLFQWHVEQELRDGILNLFSNDTIRKAIVYLQERQLISVQKNPNMNYGFDRKNYFLVNIKLIQKLINEYIKNKEENDEEFIPEKSGIEEQKSRAAITETTNTKNNLNKVVSKETTVGAFGTYEKSRVRLVKQELLNQQKNKRQTQVIDDLQVHISAIIDRWNETNNLCNHKSGTKTYLEISTMIESLFNGTCYNSVPAFKKYHNKKFTRAEVMSVLRRLDTAVNSPDHLPLDKTYVRKFRFPSFIYNRYGKTEKSLSQFLYYFEHEPLRNSESMNAAISSNDKQPETTKILKTWYSDVVMNGNNGHYTSEQLRDLVKSSNRLTEFAAKYGKGMLNGVDYWKSMYGCDGDSEVFAHMLIEMFADRVSRFGSSKFSIGYLASDKTFNEYFPDYLKSMGYLE